MRFDSFEHILSHYAEFMPDSPALRYGNTGLTFSGLYDSVKKRADQLTATGKTCIGILADGSLACVVEIFAANLAGMQIVMLDDSLESNVLMQLMHYTDIDTLWGDEDLTAELQGALTGGVCNGKDRLLFFTSGTTARSKAVVLTGHSLCQSAWNGSEKLPLSPNDTLMCMLPLGHVFGFVCGLLWGLSCGACVALGRGARHYLDDCTHYRPTAISVVPMLMGFLLKQRCINPELRLMLVGAGDCPAALLNAAAAAGLRVCFGYGLTETSSGVAISISGDPFAMEICPDDTITISEDGEILIDAPTCIMQEYYKLPGDTAEVLKDGVFHTGDLGYIDADGKLHVTGRKKDMLVMPDGTKIFLPEYESSIIQALGHSELAVTLRDGRPVLIFSGEGRSEDILLKLRDLMRHQPRGRQITDVIITADPLPRTATGKIKRWELQQKVGNGI